MYILLEYEIIYVCWKNNKIYLLKKLRHLESQRRVDLLGNGENMEDHILVKEL